MGKSIKSLFFVMAISFVIVAFWNKVPIIKETVHFVLDPSMGALLMKNANMGVTLFALIISFFIILVQKYSTDQDLLRSIKKEQKILQEEMKKFKKHPEKYMELQKKQLEFVPKTLDITLRPMMYTSIPIILFFRWFNDFFASNTIKIFGINWLLAYIILSVIFTTIFRKLLKVA